jgi:hypothetical protein
MEAEYNYEEVLQCDLCPRDIDIHRDPDTGKAYWNLGHNAYPVSEKGRCCDICNATKVIPARLKAIREER